MIKLMKIKLLKSSWGVKLLALMVLAVPAFAYANGDDFMSGIFAVLGISWGLNIFGGIIGAPTIGDIAMNVIKFILGITGVATILAIIIGGLRYITSGGNQDQMEGAKKTLTYAIIGFVIIILAYMILTLIDKIFMGS